MRMPDEECVISRKANHSELEKRENFVVRDRLWLERKTCYPFITLEHFLSRQRSEQFRRSTVEIRKQSPAPILVRISDVRQFPIQNCVDVIAREEIAEAVIAVHKR